MQQSIQLYINDELVDLTGMESIPLTFQINDLADVQNQAGNTSKQFTLALTQRNRAILGFPDDITLTTIAPYRQYSAKLVQNGVEVIPAGVAEINKVENMTCDLTVLSGNVDFFDAIDGQLYDMGDSTSIWSGYGSKLVWNKYSLPFPSDPNNINNCVWDVPHAAYSQDKTSGWIWPIIDYGAIGFPDYTGPVNVRQQRPAFFLHTAIELLVEAGGYRIDYDKSSLMKDPLYQKLLIPFSNDDFEHGTDYQNTPDNLGISTVNSINQVIQKDRDTPDGPYDPRFRGQINFNQSTYTATQNVDFTATVQFSIYIKGRVTGQTTEVIIQFAILDPDGNLTEGIFGGITFQVNRGGPNYHELGGSGGNVIGEVTYQNQKLSYDFQLVAGQKLLVRYHINNIGTGPKDTYAIFYKGATFDVVTTEKEVLYKQPIQCERILPDVSQKDFLKDTLQRFGIICQSDNVTKKITFASFKDIVNNIPNAGDWSGKMVDQGKQVYFKLGSYDQINWMRYQFDDGVLLNDMPKYFADDKIIINDTTLNTETPIQDLFVSIYAPSINRPYIGGTIAQILKIDTLNSTSEFTIGTQPRLLVDQKYVLKQKADGSGEKVTFTDVDGGGGANDITLSNGQTISIPYFFKGDGEYNLCFCDKGGQVGLRNKYYPEVEHILKYSKKIVRFFMLTPRDIKDIDFLTPVYLRQDSGYFYINKIDSWIKGVPVKVELIRL